jgi:adenosylmethionine-8-amino-7-oxononanoate aminotransferase
MSLADPHSSMHKSFNEYQPKQFCTPIPCDEYSFLEFESLIEGVHGSVAGVVIEPLVQGAGGLRFHTPDVLAEIHRIVKKYDLIFIADEVMTGFGRTGYMFACEEAGMTPDIMCLGKALTGGSMTLAAVLAKQEIFDAFLGDDLEQALMSGPTFMANPLACSAANASLDLFEQEPRLEQVQRIESLLYELLSPFVSNEKVKEVRVKGAVGVIELHQTDWESVFAMREQFIKQGVWVRPFSNVIYLMPPFVISEEDLQALVEAIEVVLS